MFLAVLKPVLCLGGRDMAPHKPSNFGRLISLLLLGPLSGAGEIALPQPQDLHGIGGETL